MDCCEFVISFPLKLLLCNTHFKFPYIYTLYIAMLKVYLDLEVSTSEDELEDDYEMKVEHWRAQRFLRQNYLDSIRVNSEGIILSGISKAVKITPL